MKTENPWNLSAREAETLDLWAIHGSQKAAARAMKLDSHTVQTYVARAAEKMNATHSTHALLMWDRFAFGREPQA